METTVDSWLSHGSRSAPGMGCCGIYEYLGWGALASSFRVGVWSSAPQISHPVGENADTVLIAIHDSIGGHVIQ
ncbi:hypothetical protein [Pasteuria penetrans]|uniref:hypothetical protein n=1 Tax=Pasteuria penetrans TaxID=86005 RepID=UPI000FA283B2|nr:hypothetical protein [Pasteuria penetrans]